MEGAALGYIALAATAASTAYGAWSANQSGKEQASNIKRQSRLQAADIMRQANATAEAQRAEARQYERQGMMDMMEAGNQKFRADEELRQGEIAQEKANIEQIKGEREAARRSRILAQEIGQQYAQFAGNGFAVDANPYDTFGAIIRSSATEGQADISTILDNAQMNQWTFEEEKRTQQRNAANSLQGANNFVFKAQSDQASAQDARSAAALTMANAQSAAADTIAYGKAAAKAARKSGRRAAWGTGLSGAAQLGMGAYSIWGK